MVHPISTKFPTGTRVYYVYDGKRKYGTVTNFPPEDSRHEDWAPSGNYGPLVWGLWDHTKTVGAGFMPEEKVFEDKPVVMELCARDVTWVVERYNPHDLEEYFGPFAGVPEVIEWMSKDAEQKQCAHGGIIGKPDDADFGKEDYNWTMTLRFGEEDYNWSVVKVTRPE